MAKPRAADLTHETPDAEPIERAILAVRGERVMLDADLAALYGVETKALNRAVQRNLERFPPDFMMRLGRDEWEILKRQFGASSAWGGRRKLPLAFTEQGVAMLSSVLRSERAVRVNIEIMRAFVRLRRILAESADLARRVAQAENRLESHESELQTHHGWIAEAFGQLDRLLAPPAAPVKRAIGFRAPKGAKPDAKPKARRKTNP